MKVTHATKRHLGERREHRDRAAEMAGAITDEARMKIVESVVVACGWGHGGIASVLLEEMDKRLPCVPTWQKLYSENHTRIWREHIGVITDEEELRGYMNRGYWLVNFGNDGCSLFNPPPMNGLCKFVSRELAAKLRPHRYQVQGRRPS